MAKPQLLSVTHINIRQSISIMVLRLLVIELLFIVIMMLFLLPLSFVSISLNVLTFILISLVKFFLSFYVIFEWLNEYYEITPTKIIHRKGFFLKHEETHTIADMSSVEFTQDFWGTLLNFGTIVMIDWYTKRETSLYLIHNPKRYFSIIQDLIPDVEREKTTIRRHLIEQTDT